MQIALFLRNISFVLGSSQASNVGGVCYVVNLRPQSPILAVRSDVDEASCTPVGACRNAGAYVDRWLRGGSGDLRGSRGGQVRDSGLSRAAP